MSDITLKFILKILLAVLIFPFSAAIGENSAFSQEICKAPEEPEVRSIKLDGIFNYRLLDETKPEIGGFWKVQIYRRSNTGIVMGYCTTETDKDGYWEATFAMPDVGSSLEVAVFAENSYVKISSHAGNAYEAARECGITISNNQQYFPDVKLFAGIWTNCKESPSEFPDGVVDIMAAALEFWNWTWEWDIDTITRDRHGIERPIRVYFPNNWYDCDNGSAVPGTCASSGEKAEIWITGRDIWIRNLSSDYPTTKEEKRLIRQLTVMHELAHILNADKWNYVNASTVENKSVDEACQEKSAALQEGFATAIAAWAIYGKKIYENPETKPKIIWLNDDRVPVRTNIELPDYEGLCQNGQKNAELISALFWDLIDTQIDKTSTSHSGQDTWFFQNSAEPFITFLTPLEQNGVLNVWRNIGNLKDAFKHNLGQSEKNQIDSIYDLNRMN